MSDLIVPQADGSFLVAGVVRALSREEADSYLVETGVYTRKEWPFERRREPRVALFEFRGPVPAELRVIHKLEI